jgi:RNA polymerase sigma factor (sigma-70 family)
MKIQEPSRETIQEAIAGSLSSVDSIIGLIQPGIFNLAVRMLGNRDDAADATQEILLKVVTHLGSFRSDSAFATWVFRVAKNHLLTASTKTRESPEVSLEGLYESLEQGMAFNAAQLQPFGGRTLQPDEKLEAKQIALGCTQKMLMGLDRDQRLSYILDTVFGLSSDDAATVLDVSSDTHRQRLARARGKLDAFAATSCGLASDAAKCQCDKQIPAVRHVRSTVGDASKSVLAVHRMEHEEVQRNFDALVRLGNASAMIRAHPQYQAPESMRLAIRSVLSAEGYLADPSSLH